MVYPPNELGFIASGISIQAFLHHPAAQPHRATAAARHRHFVAIIIGYIPDGRANRRGPRGPPPDAIRICRVPTGQGREARAGAPCGRLLRSPPVDLRRTPQRPTTAILADRLPQV